MRAPVNIFGLPNSLGDQYRIKDWCQSPLFTCTLSIRDECMVEDKLTIELEKKRQLIARAYCTPDQATVFVVEGSAKHFVLTLENGSLRALVGIAFIDRSDAIDFSFMLHEFARRHPPQLAQDSDADEPEPAMVPKATRRALSTLKYKGESSTESDVSYGGPSFTYDDSSDEFGEFQ